MSAVRTLTALGAVLGQEVQGLSQSAIEHLTLPSLTTNPGVERILEVLIDRLCLSMKLAKPVGRVGWVETHALGVGRAGIVDLATAATHTIALAARQYDVEQRRLLAFLDV